MYVLPVGVGWPWEVTVEGIEQAELHGQRADDGRRLVGEHAHWVADILLLLCRVLHKAVHLGDAHGAHRLVVAVDLLRDTGKAVARVARGDVVAMVVDIHCLAVGVACVDAVELAPTVCSTVHVCMCVRERQWVVHIKRKQTYSRPLMSGFKRFSQPTM